MINFNSSNGRKSVQYKFDLVNQQLIDLSDHLKNDITLHPNVTRVSTEKTRLLNLKAKYEALIAKADELGIKMPPEE